MDEIKILMMDGCTESEAKKHLERGTTVYSDMEENLDKYAESGSLTKMNAKQSGT